MQELEQQMQRYTQQLHQQQRQQHEAAAQQQQQQRLFATPSAWTTPVNGVASAISTFELPGGGTSGSDNGGGMDYALQWSQQLSDMPAGVFGLNPLHYGRLVSSVFIYESLCV